MGPYPKYTVRRVIPPQRKAEALYPQKVCLGISLDSEEFYGKNLSGILAWIEQHYDECLIFIGDCLYSYTLQIFSSMDSAAVTQTVAGAVTTFKDQALKYTTRSKTKFQLITLSELSNRVNFSAYKHLIKQLYQENGQFRSSIEKTAADYIRRKSKNGQLAMSSDNASSLSGQYLLEEIAFYCLLASDGWLLEVYPGSEIPVLREIIQGKIQNAPEVLQRRVFVELRKERS